MLRKQQWSQEVKGGEKKGHTGFCVASVLVFGYSKFTHSAVISHYIFFHLPLLTQLTVTFFLKCLTMQSYLDYLLAQCSLWHQRVSQAYRKAHYDTQSVSSTSGETCSIPSILHPGVPLVWTRKVALGSGGAVGRCLELGRGE